MSKEFNIGLLVMVLLTVFTVVGLQNQTKRPDPFSPRYHLLFKAVSLRPGDRVTVAGVDAGFVEKIDFTTKAEKEKYRTEDFDPQVKVTILLEAKIVVREGAKYQQRSNLKGYRWVEIMPPLEGPQLDSQTILSGELPSATEDQLTKTLSTFRRLSAETKELQQMAEDGEFRRKVKDTASNMRFYSREFARVSQNSRANLAAMDRSLAEQEAKIKQQLTRVDDMVTRMQEKLVTMTPQMTETIDGYRARLKSSQAQLRDLIAVSLKYSEEYEKLVDSISEQYKKTVVPEEIIATVHEYARKLEDMALLAEDMHTLSSDPQVQADLKKMITNLKEKSEKLKADVQRWQQMIDDVGL